MIRYLLIITALILVACDPTPAPTDTATHEATSTPSLTPTEINGIFQTATPLRATNVAQGTLTQATSSIYGDATRYAQTATERARWTPPTPTQEIWTSPTPGTTETWTASVNVNIRPTCSTSQAAIGKVEAGKSVTVKPGVITPGDGIEWRMLADAPGCVAVRSGSTVLMTRAG